MLTVRQFLGVVLWSGPLVVIGCKRGEPAKTLLLHDASGGLPRRFDDVKVLEKREDYVKFRTASGEVIEFSGRYTVENPSNQ